MKKLGLLLALAAMAAAVVAAVHGTAAHAAPARAQNLVACSYTGGQYKHSGLASQAATISTGTYNSSNANFYVRGRVLLNYAQFTATNEHSLTLISVDNYGGGQHYWVQLGLWFGYDPYGVPVKDSAGGWQVEPYLEYQDPSGYHFIAPSQGNWPSNAPIQLPYPIGHPFPMKLSSDANGNVTPELGPDGGFSLTYQFPAIHLPELGGQHYAFAEGEDYGNDGYCDYYNAQYSPQSSAIERNFWNAYTGCSDNGWNGDNPNDPNCHGGAANTNAPYDVYAQCSNGLNCPLQGNTNIAYELEYFQEVAGSGGGLYRLLAGRHAAAAPPLNPGRAPDYPDPSVTIDSTGVHVVGKLHRGLHGPAGSGLLPPQANH